MKTAQSRNPAESVLTPISGGRAAKTDSRAQSRADILVAAADCFMKNGFAATSIDDVARALGATKGMIYHHFRSKIDLFFAVYQRGMELNFEATLPESQFDAPALNRLVRMGMAHSVALMKHQSFQRVLAEGVAMHLTGSTTAEQRETLSNLIKLRTKYETLFRNAIEQAALNAGFELKDSSLATKGFLAVLNSTVFWYSPRKRNALGEQTALARDLVTFAIQGLGAAVPEETFKNWEKTL